MSDPLKVDGFRFEVAGLVVPIGLRIDSLILSGTAGEVNPDPFSIQLSEEGDVVARVSAASLAAFLRTKLPMVSDLTVRLADDRMTIDATVRVLVEIRGTAVARLLVQDERYLVVALDDVEPALLRNLLEGQLASFNPVFDAQDLPLSVRLTHVTLENDELVVYGHARP